MLLHIFWSFCMDKIDFTHQWCMNTFNTLINSISVILWILAFEDLFVWNLTIVYEGTTDRFILLILHFLNEQLFFFLDPEFASFGLFHLLILLSFIHNSLHFKFNPAHFKQVVFLYLIILTIFIISYNEEFNDIEHAFFHLLWRKHGFAILLIKVINIFRKIRRLHSFNKKPSATFLNSENFLVVGTVVSFVV